MRRTFRACPHSSKRSLNSYGIERMSYEKPLAGNTVYSVVLFRWVLVPCGSYCIVPPARGRLWLTRSIPSACRSLRARVCVDGVGVSPATRVTYQRLTMSGKSYGSGISWSCKHNKHPACSKLKCTCNCHKLWDPARAKNAKQRVTA
jgi:hypothetical protein